MGKGRERINLTGQKFGHLEVTGPSTKTDNNKGIYWECICHNCNDIVHIRSDCLRKRGQISCGCHWLNFRAGDKIYYLTVVKNIGHIDNPNRRRNNATYWECLCDCGNTINVATSTISQRGIKSCGCKTYSASNIKYPNNTNIPTYLFTRAKRGAELRSILFDITIQDIALLWDKQDGKCALSGMTLYLAPSSRQAIKVPSTASLDRIDSSKSYTPDNIQWIHKDINIMKNNFEQDYFIELCRKISDTRSKCL